MTLKRKVGEDDEDEVVARMLRCLKFEKKLKVKYLSNRIIWGIDLPLRDGPLAALLHLKRLQHDVDGSVPWDVCDLEALLGRFLQQNKNNKINMGNRVWKQHSSHLVCRPDYEGEGVPDGSPGLLAVKTVLQIPGKKVDLFYKKRLNMCASIVFFPI